MARGRNRNDDDDDRSDAEENASALMSAVNTSEGKVFGVKLPEPFLSLWNILGPDAIQWVSNEGSAAAGDIVTKATHSVAAGKAAESIVGYGMPYIPLGIKAASLAKDHKANRDLVLDPLSQLLAANKEAKKRGVLGSIKEAFSSGYDNNKMVEFALKKVTEGTYQGLRDLSADAIPSVVTNYGTFLNKLPERSERQEKHLDFITKWGNKIAGTARLGVQKSFKSIDLEEELPQTSYGKVISLNQFIKDQDLDSPSSIASRDAVLAVADKVEDIFQTYQKEQKHRHVPSHRMKEASRQIAEELVSGELHALSLVNLVGNEKLLTDKKDDIVSSERVSQIIKQETEVFSKSQAVTSEEFLKDRPFTLDDIKAHILSKDKDERALAVLLAPDSVLMEAGASKDDIKSLRNHFTKKMQESVYTNVINSLAQQSDEELADKGFSREAIVFVREHDTREEGAESVHHAMKTRGGAQAARDVVLTELMGEPSKKWQEYIASVKSEAAGKGHSGKGHTPTQARSPMDHASRETSTTQELG